jgi:hypothetical protein
MAAAPLNEDFTAIGSSFVQHYYNIFDSDRAKLQTLYRDQSMLTFESKQFMGTQAVMAHLQNLPFQKVQHQVKQVDCQPSGCGGIVVFVIGSLLVDDGKNPIMFSQLFHLIPVDAARKDFWLHNDMFRLNYG